MRLRLNEIGHIFPAGHRITLAILTAYWPVVWSSPSPLRFEVHTGGCRLILPVRARQPGDDQIRFEARVKGRDTPLRVLEGPRCQRTITRDVFSNEVIHTILRNDGRSTIEEIGIETGFIRDIVCTIEPGDPTSARTEQRPAFLHRHNADWDILVEAETALSCTQTEFVTEATLRVLDGGKPFSEELVQADSPSQHVDAAPQLEAAVAVGPDRSTQKERPRPQRPGLKSTGRAPAQALKLPCAIDQ